MMRPRLHATPLSHFSRKVRVLFAELGIDHEMVWVPNALRADPATFADNPLMRVPALTVDGQLLIESDHIARWAVERWDPGDRLGVRSERPIDLNRLAVANGVMDNEVVMILAKRGGLENLEDVTYFRKLAAAIEGGLAWLDANVDGAERFSWADVVLVCMWQHVQHYASAKNLERYPRIAERALRFADRPSIARTTPEASLAEAKAAGWQP